MLGSHPTGGGRPYGMGLPEAASLASVRKFRAGCDSGARNDGLIRSFFVRFQIIDDLNSMSPKPGVLFATADAVAPVRPRYPVTADAPGRLRSGLRPGRPAGLLGDWLRGQCRRGASGHRPERSRKILAAAPDRGPGGRGRRRDRARRRRRRAHHRRAGPLSRPPGRAEIRFVGFGKPRLLGQRARRAAPPRSTPRSPPSASTGWPACPRSICRPGNGGACRSRGSSRSRGRSGCSTSRPPASTPPPRRCWRI